MGKTIITNDSAFKQDWADGVYLRDMATKYGVDISTVSNHAKRLGLPARRKAMVKDGGPDMLKGGRWVKDARGISRWEVD